MSKPDFKTRISAITELVSWSLTSPFSTNMAISETKGQGWRAIPTLATFLYSSHPKGKWIERLI